MATPATSALSARSARVRANLDAFGQGHVFAFWDRLNDDERASLLAQCEALPLETLASAMEHPAGCAADDHARTLEPARVVPYVPEGAARYRAIGAEMVASGKVACFTVAGGQGTRLGWDGPKGTFPATPLTGKPLFQHFAESILAARTRYGGMVRWYIMTSPLNHDETTRFFESHAWFGLGASTVRLFMQGTLPSLTLEGKIVLAAPGAIALNPDGHGGAVRALYSSGALDEMRAHGIETLSYFQVDNPLVAAVDPLFLGLHAAHPESSGEVSSKVVPKRDANEKVGVFCRAGGKTMVVEYSDLSRQAAEARRADGALLHSAGSIAIHAFSRAFLERLAAGGGQLPLHRALKKVPCVELSTGDIVEPAAPNAIKLEAFIFDAVPLADRALVYETRRDEEFAPIKNAEGEDSPATSRTAQSERAARWLAAAGVHIPRDSATGATTATIEISPLTALSADDLRRCANLPASIAEGSQLLL
jgi:UDP-N-acetylglucosamine/UDP-N-acetylgalactosamine diphosphorylase